IIGLIISLFKTIKITKSKNSFRLKIFSSTVFSLLIFSSIIFFYVTGQLFLDDTFGLGLFFISIACAAGFVINLMVSIILSIKRRNVWDYDYNTKSIILYSVVSFLIIIIILFYNTSILWLSRSLKSENLCSFTLSFTDKSLVFHKSTNDLCFTEIARIKKDALICKKVEYNHRGACYIRVATASDDAEICKIGMDEGVRGMDTCFSLVAEGKQIISVEEMVYAFKNCEKTGECNSLVNMESIILSTLNNPNDPNLIYAIKATTYLWQPGQREKVITPLKNLLTTAPLESRRAVMDALIYIMRVFDLETEKKELEKILPLIENQSALSDYTEEIIKRLSAERLTPI
ncbi:MAG: hypothetical protein JW740_00970, partial [Candidatus Zambryskibacteria bacterium]|nr:hypothetical protein [Candidatus Zambryskibacteria bacterium]